MLSKAFLPCLLGLMLSYPWMSNCQVRDTTLQGQVVDASGTSLPGVRLLVVNLDTLDEQRAEIKANGKFTLPHMPPGDYALIAASPIDTPCFRPVVERVRLETDTTRTVRLVMLANPGACSGSQ
jgi:hypothetical protein